MKVFIPILCLMSLALAEPPVGDGYPSSQSSSHDEHYNDHHATDNQRSLSQEYGLPSDSVSSARNAPSNGYEYNKPGSRTSANTRGRSQFAPPTVRVSFNQRFGSSTTSARNSAQDHAASRSVSQGYAAANARSGISQEYGTPARSLSQEYGVPSVASARTLSSEYGVPDARSAPSQEYGAPVVAARSSPNSNAAASNFRSANSLSQDYSAPAARSHQTGSHSHGNSGSLARSNGATNGYDSSKPFGDSAVSSRSTPSSTYGAPSSRSSSTSHGSARNSDNHQDAVSQTYGAPNERDLSETYGAPNARGLSQEYGVPSSRANQMTDAVVSSFASARSSPSSTYLPASRNAAPSEQYGAPEQRDGGSQGYDYARARALEEELKNQEPASYDFGYQIEDQESGSDFGHTETREDDRAQGSYFVVLPDGTKQTVEYEADERGFKPRISVEPAAGGYDENAADITSSSGGPY